MFLDGDERALKLYLNGDRTAVEGRPISSVSIYRSYPYRTGCHNRDLAAVATAWTSTELIRSMKLPNWQKRGRLDTELGAEVSSLTSGSWGAPRLWSQAARALLVPKARRVIDSPHAPGRRRRIRLMPKALQVWQVSCGGGGLTQSW